MKDLSLMEYLKSQHHPPEIQEQLEKLFGKPKSWRWASSLGSGVSAEIIAQQVGWSQCAEELDSILRGKP